MVPESRVPEVFQGRGGGANRTKGASGVNRVKVASRAGGANHSKVAFSCYLFFVVSICTIKHQTFGALLPP